MTAGASGHAAVPAGPTVAQMAAVTCPPPGTSTGTAAEAVPGTSTGAAAEAVPGAASGAGRAAAPSSAPLATPLLGPAAPPPVAPYRPAPGEVLVCVGAAEIDGATFAQWARVAEHSGPAAGRHAAAEPTHAQMTEVVGFLISAQWIAGEAADLHIAVSPAAVRHRFVQLRRKQFHERGAFRAFLKRSGETVSGLLLRVRTDMLSTLIEKRVAGHGSTKARERRLSQWARQFERKWRGQTYCEAAYRVPSCGHTVSAL